jgi:hypothetical protein
MKNGLTRFVIICYWGRAKLFKLDEHASDDLRKWCALAVYVGVCVHGREELGLQCRNGMLIASQK